MVADERCSRYHVDGFSLVIRDVAEEDAGIYTILTGIQQYGLFQNLTLTLVVNGETKDEEIFLNVIGLFLFRSIFNKTVL